MSRHLRYVHLQSVYAPRPTGPQAADGYASDNLDEPEEAPAPKKRKQSKAAEAKQKEKEKAKAKKKAKKGDDDDDYEDSDQDPYSALSKMWKGDIPKPPVGSFEDCARCKKQFTVVRPSCYDSSCPEWILSTLPVLRRSTPWRQTHPLVGCAIYARSPLVPIPSRNPLRLGNVKLLQTSATSSTTKSVASRALPLYVSTCVQQETDVRSSVDDGTYRSSASISTMSRHLAISVQ